MGALDFLRSSLKSFHNDFKDAVKALNDIFSKELA